MMKSKLLVSAAALCAAFSLSAEAKLYKWVDKNGTTHYGETIPPEYADRDTKQIEKGRVKERTDGFDSKMKDASKTDPAIERANREAKRRDEALLSTYSSEKEIDLARDRNLLQVEARINSYTTMLKSAQTSLDELYRERDALAKQGRKTDEVLNEITQAEALVAKRQKELDTNQKEMDAVKARYETDKQRYRELKGIPGGK
jgi:chromosome segregation ATPase